MFICCGDALFDLFARPEERVGDGAIRLDGRVGGSPLNVAVGLARFGDAVGYLCKNSTDLFGARIGAFLEANGVASDWILESSRNSTLAIVQTDASGAPTYVFYTDGTADLSMREEELPQSLPETVAVVHVGSYSTGVGATAATLLALARRESGRRVISYDPNVRLPIEPDLDVWRERFAGFAATAALVKASDEDIAALAGEGCSDERFAADAIGRGAALVIVTRGADGARLFARDGRESVAPRIAVDVVDTVGAGDTFQAATLHGLRASGALDGGTIAVERLDLDELADFAASAAAITCTRSGADLPTLEEVERFRAARRD